MTQLPKSLAQPTCDVYACLQELAAKQRAQLPQCGDGEVTAGESEDLGNVVS